MAWESLNQMMFVLSSSSSLNATQVKRTVLPYGAFVSGGWMTTRGSSEGRNTTIHECMDTVITIILYIYIYIYACICVYASHSAAYNNTSIPYLYIYTHDIVQHIPVYPTCIYIHMT